MIGGAGRGEPTGVSAMFGGRIKGSVTSMSPNAASNHQRRQHRLSLPTQATDNGDTYLCSKKRAQINTAT